MRDFNTLVLAALLHDIGKFLHRGRSLSFPVEGPHPAVSASFVRAFSKSFGGYADVSLLETLVHYHHSGDITAARIPDPHRRLLAHIVSKADSLSAAERGRQDARGQDYKTTPLAPVFERISLDETRRESATRYHPVALTPPEQMEQRDKKGLFPDAKLQEYASNELEDLLTQFGGMSRPVLEGTNFTSFDGLISYLLDLLQTHTWPVPSDTQLKVPDVSLFDHLKSTAAIAACLYRFCEANGGVPERSLREIQDKEAFVLTVGDLSGIQSYLFDIATGDEIGKGVARRLRARSLFIQLVCEVAVLCILKRLGLPPTNQLMSSGGKFYLLLPNVPETIKALREMRQEFDRWCVEEMRAEMALNLAWISFGEADLKLAGEALPKGDRNTSRGFGAIVERAMQQLALQKERRLGGHLAPAGRWDETRFMFAGFEGAHVCRSCSKFPMPSGADLCTRCALDLEWGRRLPEAGYVVIRPDRRGEVNIFGYGVSLLGRNERDMPSGACLTIAINAPAAAPVAGAPTMSKYLVSRVPTSDTKEALTWEDLAKESSGRSYLGFLKADADRLGQVFASGLRGFDTVSRLATLSRELDLFFSGWIQHILTEKEFSNCYPVFCGGDDLLVVGPWDTTVKLASRVQEDYRAFTCHNPHMTISAGVLIADSHYPISQASKDVEHLLEGAKDEGRDRISILGRTLTWSDWAKISREWEALRVAVQEEQAPTALLYRLLEYGRMWQSYRRKDKPDPLGLRAQPLLAYSAARTLDPRRQPRLCAWVAELVAVKPLDERQAFLLDNLTLLAQLLILGKGGE